MAAHTLTCPACLSPLRSNRPLPADKVLRCPECGSQFTAIPPPVSRPALPPRSVAAPPTPPNVILPEPAAPPPSRTAPLVIAVAVAALLGVGGAVGGYLLLRERPQQQPAVTANEETQQRNDEEKRKLDEERARLEQDRRKLDAAKLVAQADAALAKKQYDVAADAYDKALRLDPDNAEAKAGLIRARAEALAASKVQDDEAKKQAEYDRLMNLGKKAMAARQYADAAIAFETALKVMPGDRAADDALLRAKAAANDDTAEKKRLADYQQHMDAGRVAMNAGRYADAVKEFLAAQRAVPNDPAAVQAQQVAEKRLGDLQDKEKRAAEYDKLMARAAAAMKEKRYDDAIHDYEAAIKLFPGEREPQQGLRQAKQARSEGKDEFQRWMAQGDMALRSQQLEAAVRAYSEAVKISPQDEGANRALKTAQFLLANVQTAQSAYVRNMISAVIAMRSGLYADAAAAYAQVLQLVPTDVIALQGLKDARAQLLTNVQVQTNYNQQMQVAATALRTGQYADAVRAYQAALQLLPGDPQATSGLQKAKYGRAMADGRAALMARRFNQAVRHFEDALKQVPNDPQATALLRQAKAMRK